MPTHITLRLAWHNDGWNGRICQSPANNTYCVGCYSYPGEMIREQRDLVWEKENAGKRFADLDKPAACMYSGSAFSDASCEVIAEPPDFFKDETETRRWAIPPSTACTWPYEAMYNMEGVKTKNGFDYAKRLEYAEEYFKPIEKNSSLVFYYANYSNPLSGDDEQQYLLVGVARIKEVAPMLYYDNCSEKTLERYKGFVWQRGITSHYPEQGVRLPYHRYLHDMDALRKFAAYPENTNLCKYATKHVTDDEALGLLEQLLHAARIVRDDLQDASENWDQRIQWLECLIAELWQSRGAYPGMPAALEYLGLKEAISGFRQLVEQGNEEKAVAEIRDFLAGKSESLVGYHLLNDELDDFRRDLLLEHGDHINLLIDKLARCSVSVAQLKAIMSNDRDEVGVMCTLKELEENPYLLAEQYTGIDAKDAIRWSFIDRGMLPSPELPAQPVVKKNAKQRMRALILETLRGNQQQTFVELNVLVSQINARIKSHPEWKQSFLTDKYFSVDKAFYDEAIYQRAEDGRNYIYDRFVWDDERLTQEVMDDLLVAADIKQSKPLNKEFWKKVLFRQDSSLADNAKDEYLEAIEGQKQACSKIINKRVSAITGGAGTGKSTIVAALIKAIHNIHGDGHGVAVITPTGKAADRLRRSFRDQSLESVSTSTIHSILARYGWLNPNMTFKRVGGKKLAEYSTIIIDESSMIDLVLMAALFRAIDWNCVGRLILVGDAAQLPPIGIGKVYADTVCYLREHYADHFVELKINLRQLENRVSGKGNGILSLANCFINNAVRGEVDESEDQAVEREKLITRLHESGNVDKDLRIVYWNDAEAMQEELIRIATDDFSEGKTTEKEPAKIWGEALKADVNIMQILSPVRGELHGTESINQKVQAFKSADWLVKGNVNGITMFDKVIQIVNRPASRPLRAYNFDSKKEEKFEVFNGEIGVVTPKGYEWKSIGWSGFRVKDLSVKFSSRENFLVNYFGRASDTPELNLELAYAISVHKAQGSEFKRVYFVLPAANDNLSKELLYTALTRASEHCTVFVQNNVSTLVNAMRPEQSALSSISSSLFEFKPVSDVIAGRKGWYEAGKIHEAITGDMVRSKSEVIIANMLHERSITFWYEKPLLAPDGTLYLPDFTIQHRGEFYYWEHLGLMSQPQYREHWEEKRKWYETHFSSRLFTTQEGSDLSKASDAVITKLLKI